MPDNLAYNVHVDLQSALLHVTPAPTAGDQSFCNDAPYKRDSTYMSNLRSLAGALIGDAARLHSATGAAGKDPDTVYGAVLCRADSAGADCARRLRDALAAIDGDGRSPCALHRDVAVYSELYQLRFSDRNFLANFSNAPEWVDVTNPDLVPLAVAAQLDERVMELLGAVADAAAGRPGRWAVGEALWSSSGDRDRTVYGLAQCTRDMPPDHCRACLDGVMAERRRKIGSGKMGTAVFGARCTLRYEMDLQFFNVTGNSKMVSLRKKKDRAFFIIATAYTSAVLCTRLFFWLLSVWRKQKRKMDLTEEPQNMDEILRLWRIEDASLEFSFYDFSQIADATDNFSPKNILGEGGFGPVYKGVFPDGQEVAIKRLSARSRQGLIEFKNEIQIIAKLQHKNLVRLLGYCIHEEEKMLIYEYLTNKSLDHFIFDPIRQASLKWKRRIKIVDGIAQGLLYLHNLSRIRIIHRDLKASNILLDSDLNPKISDFGMARIFPSDATQATASRLVGTYGYMAPEYVSDGLLSIKSDVFSFGVLLLEIISGKRSSGFQHNGEFYNLLEYAWELWKDRRSNEFIDQSFGDDYEMEELMKYLAVALLCVQEKTIDRPTMPDVVAILSSDGITLPEPKQPAYSYAKLDVSVNVAVLSSRNDVTITTTNGR
ncbi:cysteine-rich receptor-like protein kinase 6 [Miscanthus floridulus]|uniref:cysteine-rich receptor-like protein kinase 6 n=1 Tax=Miscanthus floridulus TaxID=154761 RepID=UPI003458B88C